VPQARIILCNVPPAVLISGEVVGSETPATGWHVQKNTSTNAFWGYAVTDGSDGNVLTNNAASDNTIDVEVLGDSGFFGFFTPTASNSVIAIGSNRGISIHDCAQNTQVNGNGNLIDPGDVPCF